VAMALYGPVTHDSRVLREAEALTRAGHSVTICCLSGAAPPGAPFRTLTHAPSRSRVMPDGTSPFLAASGSAPWKRLASRMRWVLGYSRNLRAWGRWAVVAAGDVDVWHAHDLTGLLAVGPSVRSPRRLVYDSHEIFLETGTAARLPMPLRRLLGTFEGFLARRAVALVTVNETYEEVLRRRLRPRRTVIVRNFPPRWFPPSPDHARLRDAAGVDEAQPLILYHGSFLPNRGIEQLAESILVPGLEAVHVALLGFGVLRPILEQMARDARFGGRLHVLDAVPPDELLDWVSGADAAVSLLQPTNEEHLLSTPNKLWESLAAGVPVIVSDFPVMRRIVLDDAIGQLGVTCDPTDPRSIATAIRDIVERPPGEREVLRSRCLRAAHEQWNWETESTRLVELYADIVPER
jgi:glycosyltransferase involved in cell wall biosynthesis